MSCDFTLDYSEFGVFTFTPAERRINEGKEKRGAPQLWSACYPTSRLMSTS